MFFPHRRTRFIHRVKTTPIGPWGVGSVRRPMSTDLPDTMSPAEFHGSTYVVRVAVHRAALEPPAITRSEEHTSELQSH